MSQRQFSRPKKAAAATKRKNQPKLPRIRNHVVDQLAKKQGALTMRKIESSVGSRASQEPGNFNMVRIDKQLLGRLSANKPKNV